MCEDFAARDRRDELSSRSSGCTQLLLGPEVTNAVIAPHVSLTSRERV